MEKPLAFRIGPATASLSADGSAVTIGAPYNEVNGFYKGHVRIYQRNSDGTWTKSALISMEKQKMIALDGVSPFC